MMKFTQLKAVGAIAGACAALFAAGSAQAYTYAVSKLDIKDLNVSSVVAGTNIDVSAATNYSFTLTNTAGYSDQASNSYSAIGSKGCKGNASDNTTNCGKGGVVLDANVANVVAPGLTSARAENDFAQLGSNGTQSFSNADSQISTAKLVDPTKLTNSQQIAESLLNINGQAFANTEVKSTTTLVTNLFFSGLTDLNISFEALLKMTGAISELPGGLYTSQANSNVLVSLTKKGSTGNWTWTPDGDNTTGCTGSGFGFGSTCVENADTWNLGGGNQIGGNTESFDLSSGGFKNFGVSIKNLVGGEYTLNLTSTTSSYVDRQYVPEPGSLALVGLALAGLGLAGKRRARNSK
ncbi:EDSAP-1 family PEP-CTERM protein [Roseateles sp.]|uniref:EDSAP-1 family PEP-CTERM protein n=1 Tax=Roseateles sp. TaxID=1971397 RepID=UPI003BA75765